MKTKFRKLGMALILAVAVIGVNASETRNIADIASEPTLKAKSQISGLILFSTNENSSNAGTVVDIAVANSDFSILVEAVSKADLAEALSAKGPFTVFAPTNEAFRALFEELGIDDISDLSAEQLTPILTYHVVPGKIMSGDLSNTLISTLNGKEIEIDLSKGVKINESNVIKADISGSNGVIHVIDKVLIPKEEKNGCSN